ncbi:unnamed protein product, partial [Didymodactylos carnosus]
VQFADVYIIPKDGGTSFTIRHYAAPVVYNIVGLLEKNRDTLPNSIVFAARTSNNSVVQELFRCNLNEKGTLPPSSNTSQNLKFKRTESSNVNKENGSGGDGSTSKRNYLKLQEKFSPSYSNVNTMDRGTTMRTVAYHFKHSLTELIEKMNSCECHFVRCIKPNDTKDKQTCLANCVSRQLRYSGVLNMCEIRRKGYPLRVTFSEFLQRYANFYYNLQTE